MDDALFYFISSFLLYLPEFGRHTFKKSIKRSSQLCYALCSEWIVGNTAITSCVMTKQGVLDTELNTGMLSTECQYVVVVCKRPVPKSAAYGKPTNQGFNQLKFKHCPRSVAEEHVGRDFKTLHLLNSYWVSQDSTYNFFEIIMVDPYNKAICHDAKIN